MVNRVIYLRWGERYNEDHVKRLEQQVKDNCSVPYEFSTINYCYAGPDFDLMKHKQNTHFRGNDVEEAVGEQKQMLREDLGGLAHFQKILMFKWDRELFDDDDKLLYIDLDSNIKGDLAYFFDLDLDKPRIAYDWDSFNNNTWQKLYTSRAQPLYNSSVILWKPGQCNTVWTNIRWSFDAAFYQYGMLDNWLFHRFGPYAYNDKNKNYFLPFEENIISDDGIISTMSGKSIEEKYKCLV